jgi:hypothetical protein
VGKSHSLYHARAPSQPGNNDGATSTLGQAMYHQAPTVDYADQHGVETHGLYHARAPSQPGNNGGAYSGLDHAGQRRKESEVLYHVPGGNTQREEVPQREETLRGSGSYDKIRQAFKCPKFSG